MWLCNKFSFNFTLRKHINAKIRNWFFFFILLEMFAGISTDRATTTTTLHKKILKSVCNIWLYFTLQIHGIQRDWFFIHHICHVSSILQINIYFLCNTINWSSIIQWVTYMIYKRHVSLLLCLPKKCGKEDTLLLYYKCIACQIILHKNNCVFKWKSITHCDVLFVCCFPYII